MRWFAVLPIPRAAVSLLVPLWFVPLAILPGRLAQKGESEESGGAIGEHIADRFAAAARATATSTATESTSGCAHESFRVAGGEGTRATALARPTSGVKDKSASSARRPTNERFLRTYNLQNADLLPVLARHT